MLRLSDAPSTMPSDISDMQADVAIVGAGPAGSAAAIELARAGCRVLLFEKRCFPREKVCGGCLSAHATTRLRRLLGDDSSVPGVPTVGLTFIIGSYRLPCAARGRTRIVLRSDLDLRLARAAAAAGADVQFGQAAGLVPGRRGWDVLAGGVRVRAKTILLACGLGPTAASLGVRGQPRRLRLVAQQWTQPAAPPLPPVGCVEMHWLLGGYVGLATPDVGRTIVAIAAEVRRGTAVHRRPDGVHESAWQRLRRLNPGRPIWAVLPPDAPRRFLARGAAGFPWMPQRLGNENVLLIGDAAGHEEPFSGEGIGQALCSAACAAQAILSQRDVLPDYVALMRRYHEPANRRLRWLGGVLRSPTLRRLAAGPALVSRRALGRLVEWVHLRVPA